VMEFPCHRCRELILSSVFVLLFLGQITPVESQALASVPEEGVVVAVFDPTTGDIVYLFSFMGECGPSFEMYERMGLIPIVIENHP